MQEIQGNDCRATELEMYAGFLPATSLCTYTNRNIITLFSLRFCHEVISNSSGCKNILPLDVAVHIGLFFPLNATFDWKT